MKEIESKRLSVEAEVGPSYAPRRAQNMQQGGQASDAALPPPRNDLLTKG